MTMWWDGGTADGAPNTIPARNFSLVKMSAGSRDVIWLIDATDSCGFAPPEKSVAKRHEHRGAPVGRVSGRPGFFPKRALTALYALTPNAASS